MGDGVGEKRDVGGWKGNGNQGREEVKEEEGGASQR